MKTHLTKHTLISTIITTLVALASLALIATPLLLSSPAEAVGTAGPMTMTFSATPSAATVGSYITVVASVEVPTTANPINYTAVRFSYDKTKLKLASHSSVGSAFNYCSYANNSSTDDFPQYSCYSYTTSLRSGTVAIATFYVMSPGSSEVTNGAIANPATDIYASPYTVSVAPVTINTSADEIASNTFGHTIDGEYVQSIAQYTTAATIKTQFDNPTTELELWDANDTSELPDNTQVATGQILKLMVNGQERDRRAIIVKGDINGDSDIDADDFTAINDYLSLKPVFDYLSPAYWAADVVGDGLITVLDFNRLNSHINGNNYLHPQPCSV